jgi:hypothetical protein
VDEKSRSPPSHFFTLRLWPEEMGAEEPAWRGRLQHTVSGEVRYFQGWEALVELVQLLISEKK